MGKYVTECDNVIGKIFDKAHKSNMEKYWHMAGVRYSNGLYYLNQLLSIYLLIERIIKRNMDVLWRLSFDVHQPSAEIHDDKFIYLLPKKQK